MKVNIKTLPIYLQTDINNYLKAVEQDARNQNDLWCELYGSINGAQYGGDITEEVAWELREEILWIYRSDLVWNKK